ncbi:MAG: cyclase family protein, partial [Flavobacteriales bacterium]|nr:cyclase family protein [Flavobacteriales bacterium]
MIGTFCHRGKTFKANLSRPLDISVPIRAGEKGVQAWYVPPVKMEPVRTEHFLGSVAEGGDVNFRNVSFNPHGHGTHTECVGHIAQEVHSINQVLRSFFSHAYVHSLTPEKIDGDRVITLNTLKKIDLDGAESLCLRTLPNAPEKLSMDYSDTNPAYMSLDAMQWVIDNGIKHLLLDVPSVDREKDGGELAA